MIYWQKIAFLSHGVGELKNYIPSIWLMYDNREGSSIYFPQSINSSIAQRLKQ